MAKGEKSAGFMGRTVVETVEFAESTGLMVSEGSRPASPRGRGAKRNFSQEGVERFLEGVRKYMAMLEEFKSAALEGYEQSCRERISFRRVLKPNYVKLEVVMRPGKPHQPSLSLAQQLEAELKQLRKALGEERS